MKQQIETTADQILKKHEDENEMHFHQVDRKWIVEAMEEYAALRQPPVNGSGFSAFRSPKINNKKMTTKMYVECIEKPSKYEFTTTDVTLGKIYPVKWIDESDYQIVDDKGNVRYYRQKFFKDAEWHGVLA